MQDDSYRAFLDMVAFDLPKPAKVATPVLVLGAARDNMLRSGENEATARAYITQSEINTGVAHNSMLEPRWQAVAERILVWLTARDFRISRRPPSEAREIASSNALPDNPS